MRNVRESVTKGQRLASEAVIVFRSKSPRQKIAALAIAAGAGLSPVLVHDAVTDNLPKWLETVSEANELAIVEGWHNGSALTGNYGPGPADGIYQASEEKGEEARDYLAVAGLEFVGGLVMAGAGVASARRFRQELNIDR